MSTVGKCVDTEGAQVAAQGWYRRCVEKSVG